MSILTVIMGNEERHIPFAAGPSLRDILDATDLRVRSGCRGLGTCGLCRVRIEAGDGGASSPNERLMLDVRELEEGIRLACQVTPRKDIRIELLSPAPKSQWKSLPGGPGRDLRSDPLIYAAGLLPDVANPYGVAADLGTTNVSLSLYELASGKWLAGRYGLNPQARYGSDVVTRLVAAADSPKCAREMSESLLDVIRGGLFDIAVREGIDIGNVVILAVVGNTPMLALLSGKNHQLLIKPEHWVKYVDCLPETTDAWVATMGIHPRAVIRVLPPLAGFVGSDLLAGVVATELTEHGKGALLIDFGTNSEIALWDGSVLWVTSAAGGPAFEESGISCGVPAEPGAIHRVMIRNGALAFNVIAADKPRGLCGSGMVDLIACLVRSGLLSGRGRFAPSVPMEGFTLGRGEREITLTGRDVDMFQRAKAAIGTGIQVLLDRAGMGFEELRRICVAGIFGRFLDIANAREIGLLPGIAPDRVELCGNTALAGCADLMISASPDERLECLLKRARFINLSGCEDFDEIFLRNLYLRPMGRD